MIPVRNWLFLLAFHWRDAGLLDDALVGGCDFDRPYDVAARLLEEVLRRLWRRGLEVSFRSFDDAGPRPRGAIDLATTLRERLEERGRLAFRYEDLTTDTPANRLLKAAIFALLRIDDVDAAMRGRLRRHLDLLADVATIEPGVLLRRPIEPPRRERAYAEALHIARLVLQQRLVDERAGSGAGRGVQARVPDDRAADVFEGFVRGAAGFYCAPDGVVTHPVLQPVLTHASSRARSLVPDMRLDARIRWPDGRDVVVECKFYEKPLIAHHHGDTRRLHADHVYQLTSYLRAVQRSAAAAAGILVYARVDEAIDESFGLEGFAVRVVGLDLMAEWRVLRDQICDVVLWRGNAIDVSRGFAGSQF